MRFYKRINLADVPGLKLTGRFCLQKLCFIVLNGKPHSENGKACVCRDGEGHQTSLDICFLPGSLRGLVGFNLSGTGTVGPG